MNAMRRKRLWEIRARIADIKEGLQTVKDDIEQIRDEEQDAFDSMPEALQESSRGEDMQTALEKLAEAIDSLDDLDLEEIMDTIEEAASI